MKDIIDYIDTDYGSIPIRDIQEKTKEAEQSSSVVTSQIVQTSTEGIIARERQE